MDRSTNAAETVSLSWVGKGEGATTARVFPRRSPDWLTLCWAVGCGWERKAQTEEAARALKAQHLDLHPHHRVTVVRV